MRGAAKASRADPLSEAHARLLACRHSATLDLAAARRRGQKRRESGRGPAPLLAELRPTLAICVCTDGDLVAFECALLSARKITGSDDPLVAEALEGRA
jgi:hypothetical protein